MHTEMKIRVGDNSYKIEKSDKFFGYYQFWKIVSAERGLMEYMGSCVANNLPVELGKLVWGTKCI